MDWNRVEGNWKQFKGPAKEKWGKLTDDDLNVIEGRREQLEGKLQQRYGFAQDQIDKDVDDWVKRLKEDAPPSGLRALATRRGFLLRPTKQSQSGQAPRIPRCISAARSRQG